MLFWEHEPVYSNAIVGFAILFYLSTFFSCSLYDKVFLEEKTDHYPIGALIEIWVFMKKKYACQKLELHTQSKKIVFITCSLKERSTLYFKDVLQKCIKLVDVALPAPSTWERDVAKDTLPFFCCYSLIA